MLSLFHRSKNAGENLAEVLKVLRSPGLPPFKCAMPSHGTCRSSSRRWWLTAHGRRNFVKVTASFPGQCRFVLETFREIYGYDAVAREPLSFHQEHSQPVMDKLQAWLMAQFEEKLVEPNSGLQAERLSRAGRKPALL